MKIQLLAVAFAGCLSQAVLADDVTALESDKDKISYGLGMMISERVLNNYGEIDYDILMQAIKTHQAGGETLLSVEEAQAALQSHQAQAASEKASMAAKAGEDFLKENAAREEVSVTDSGLQYEVLTATEGDKPTVEDTVTVDYVGTLLDGTEFDSSVARGEPASFPLKGVIPGWTEGLQLMTVGSKFKFYIPANLAYGDRGAGQAIGPGETLIFEVELHEIKK